MSWEGYYQCICYNGHYYERDGYEDDKCEECGMAPIWDHQVDETNGGCWSEKLKCTVYPDECIPCVVEFDQQTGKAIVPTQIIPNPSYNRMPDDFFDDPDETPAITDRLNEESRAKAEMHSQIMKLQDRIRQLEELDVTTTTLLGRYVKYASYCKSCARSGESDPMSFDDFEAGNAR